MPVRQRVLDPFLLLTLKRLIAFPTSTSANPIFASLFCGSTRSASSNTFCASSNVCSVRGREAAARPRRTRSCAVGFATTL